MRRGRRRGGDRHAHRDAHEHQVVDARRRALDLALVGERGAHRRRQEVAEEEGLGAAREAAHELLAALLEAEADDLARLLLHRERDAGRLCAHVLGLRAREQRVDRALRRRRGDVPLGLRPRVDGDLGAAVHREAERGEDAS